MHAQMTRTARPARRAAQVLACVLVLALLCSQWLGMVHRVVHVPMPVLAGVQAHKTLQTSTLTSPVIQGEAVRATGAGAVDAAEPGLSVATGVLAHVATPAKSDQDCRLYDQLGVSDALTALPLLWAAQVFKAHLASPVAHCHTPGAVLVAARGPPLNF